MTDKQHLTARRAALNILNRVFAGDGYADILLDKEIGKVKDYERPFLTELTYGVIRNSMRLDYIIDLFSKIKSKKLEHKVLNTLRLGIYQLLFLDKVPAHSAINESVNLLKGQKFKTIGFANAVLRAVDKKRDEITYPEAHIVPAKRLSVYYSHPLWLVEKWMKRYGVVETEKILEANQLVPPFTIRVNKLKTSREDYNKYIKDNVKDSVIRNCNFSPQGIIVEKNASAVLEDKKNFYVQDESSQLVALLLNPKAGDMVLDACSAPGGKTTHMSELMDNDGLIVAMDKKGSRLRTVEKNAKRLNIDIIKTLEGDATGVFNFQNKLFTDGDDDKLVQKAFDNGFDKILIDAPCSGLGVIRRVPDIKIRRKEENIEETRKIQLELLENLKKFLKPDGELVYSVCSLEHEETEEVVEEFLKNNQDFTLADPMENLPASCEKLFKRGYIKCVTYKYGLDGFFAARLIKKSKTNGDNSTSV